jgi:hypothetical protein
VAPTGSRYKSYFVAVKEPGSANPLAVAGQRPQRRCATAPPPPVIDKRLFICAMVGDESGWTSMPVVAHNVGRSRKQQASVACSSHRHYGRLQACVTSDATGRDWAQKPTLEWPVAAVRVRVQTRSSGI